MGQGVKRQFLFLLLPLLLAAETRPLPPDGYTKEGYCLVSTKKQRVMGLLRFANAEQFSRSCRGVMVFRFPDPGCRYFHSEGMAFDIRIRDAHSEQFLPPGKRILMCGKQVVERLP